MQKNARLDPLDREEFDYVKKTASIEPNDLNKQHWFRERNSKEKRINDRNNSRFHPNK
jgi:hypothetical protein